MELRLGFFALTDPEWYRFLLQRPQVDEVNFWQPHGGRTFRALSPGEPIFYSGCYSSASSARSVASDVGMWSGLRNLERGKVRLSSFALDLARACSVWLFAARTRALAQ